LTDVYGELIKPAAASRVVLQFTEAMARAYQLLHVFLHELGHYRDRMTMRTQKHSARGEGFADGYAMRCMERVWERYLDTCGLL
jgi:hypothetical protein